MIKSQVQYLIARINTKDEGASAVEYALLVAGIAAVIVATVFILGATVDGIFDGVNDAIGG
jgi:pilus assembly protein Flp/PilA